MTKTEIKALKEKGLSSDSIYQLIAGNLNLFGVAFFGHKGKPGDKRKLKSEWNKIISVN